MIGNKKRLERENGINKLKGDSDTMKSPQTVPWEKRHGGIMAVAVLVEKNDSFIDHIKNVIPGLLEDSESRVRIETGYKTINYVHVHVHDVMYMYNKTTSCQCIYWHTVN